MRANESATLSLKVRTIERVRDLRELNQAEANDQAMFLYTNYLLRGDSPANLYDAMEETGLEAVDIFYQTAFCQSLANLALCVGEYGLAPEFSPTPKQVEDLYATARKAKVIAGLCRGTYSFKEVGLDPTGREVINGDYPGRAFFGGELKVYDLRRGSLEVEIAVAGFSVLSVGVGFKALTSALKDWVGIFKDGSSLADGRRNRQKTKAETKKLEVNRLSDEVELIGKMSEPDVDIPALVAMNPEFEVYAAPAQAMQISKRQRAEMKLDATLGLGGTAPKALGGASTPPALPELAGAAEELRELDEAVPKLPFEIEEIDLEPGGPKKDH